MLHMSRNMKLLRCAIHRSRYQSGCGRTTGAMCRFLLYSLAPTSCKQSPQFGGTKLHIALSCAQQSFLMLPATYMGELTAAECAP